MVYLNAHLCSICAFSCKEHEQSEGALCPGMLEICHMVTLFCLLHWEKNHTIFYNNNNNNNKMLLATVCTSLCSAILHWKNNHKIFHHNNNTISYLLLMYILYIAA